MSCLRTCMRSTGRNVPISLHGDEVPLAGLGKGVGKWSISVTTVIPAGHLVVCLLCRCMFCEPGRRHVVLHLHGLRSFLLALHVLHFVCSEALFGAHSVRSPCRSYRTVFPSSTGLLG